MEQEEITVDSQLTGEKMGTGKDEGGKGSVIWMGKVW